MLTDLNKNEYSQKIKIMSLFSENVIPGNQGKIFRTNAERISDLERIVNIVTSIEGVRDVTFDSDVFPREFTVHTTKMVRVKDVEDAVISLGFHAVPRGLMEI